jgi:hypothetical protein
MDRKGWILFRVLLNKYHKGSTDSLLSYFPQDKVKTVLSQDVRSDEAIKAIEPIDEKIEHIHYSWLTNTLQGMPPSIKNFVFGALSEQHQKGLTKLVDIPVSDRAYIPVFKNYLLHYLYHQVDKENVLPVAFLPNSQLNSLTNLTKAQLVELIDFLGLHDLVGELKRVVDKKVLKNIYSCLSKQKQLFLKSIMPLRDKFVVPHLGLDHWNGNREKLETVLHRRGIIRLGKALSGQHPDLIWHISRRLDHGRGDILLQNYSKEDSAGLAPSLTVEVANAQNFMKMNNEKPEVTK